jgi:hypothetical protein
MQATTANAIDALFVFLHLLKSHAKLFGKSFLGETDRQSTNADVLADKFIDPGCGFVRGFGHTLPVPKDWRPYNARHAEMEKPPIQAALCYIARMHMHWVEFIPIILVAGLGLSW